MKSEAVHERPTGPGSIEPGRVYAMEEVARLLGVSRSTAYAMTKRTVDPLPFKDAGGRKVLGAALLKWLAGE